MVSQFHCACRTCRKSVQHCVNSQLMGRCTNVHPSRITGEIQGKYGGEGGAQGRLKQENGHRGWKGSSGLEFMKFPEEFLMEKRTFLKNPTDTKEKRRWVWWKWISTWLHFHTEDLCPWYVNGDWVHTNKGGQLSGLIADGVTWQAQWQDLSMIPDRRHN